MSDSTHRHPYRSFFWPILLIGVGVIWLLHNLNLIPVENLWIVLRLWPVLFIVAGLDVLFARRFAPLGALLGLLVIGGVIYILLQGESLGIDTGPVVKTETFAVELGDTTFADVDIDLSVEEAALHVLEDSDQLLEARIGHVGNIDFNVNGDQEKDIALSQSGWEAYYDVFLPESSQGERLWDIGLAPEVPFILTVAGGTGSAELDLAGIELENFRFDGGTGASTIILPAAAAEYEAQLETGTGKVHLVFPEETTLTVHLNSGTGQVILDFPEGSAVQILVQSGGTGDLLAPDWLTKVSGEEGRDEGTYESVGFDDAKAKLFIIIEDIGTGNIVIH